MLRVHREPVGSADHPQLEPPVTRIPLAVHTPHCSQGPLPPANFFFEVSWQKQGFFIVDSGTVEVCLNNFLVQTLVVSLMPLSKIWTKCTQENFFFSGINCLISGQ